MKKNPLIYLNHIQDCLLKTQEYTSNINERDFLNNSLIQDGVIRNLEIIREATKQLDPEFRLKYRMEEDCGNARQIDTRLHWCRLMGSLGCS